MEGLSGFWTCCANPKPVDRPSLDLGIRRGRVGVRQSDPFNSTLSMTSTLYIPANLTRWTRPSDWSGTPWDGYYLAPVAITRDSGTLDRSNWISQNADLDAHREDVPGEDTYSPIVVREGHWAVGWIEWVAIHESNESALRAADEIAASLENYPVLDDRAHFQMEWDEYVNAWSSYGCREFIRALSREFDLKPETVDRLQSADDGVVHEWFHCLIPSGDYYTAHSDGVSIRTSTAVKNLIQMPNCRTMLAQFLRTI